MGARMMLQEFWSYFVSTGDIGMYLNYKAYEKASQSPSGIEEPRCGE